MYEGLLVVVECRYRRVKLEVDLEVVARVCSDMFTGGGERNSLLRRIRSLMSNTMKLEVRHIYREANVCVDALANIGSRLSLDFVFFDRVSPVSYS